MQEFVREFNDDAVRRSGLREGGLYRVADLGLHEAAGDLEGVRLGFTLICTETGTRTEAILDESAAYCRGDRADDDLLERVAERYGLDPDEARRRLTGIGLEIASPGVPTPAM